MNIRVRESVLLVGSLPYSISLSSLQLGRSSPIRVEGPPTRTNAGLVRGNLLEAGVGRG